jgi:precorrin-6B methylase 1
MFYARAYRLAAARIGVNDYRVLVTEKLTTARELYDSMVNEFHQSRAFVLELMVVVILLIEIVMLFRGKG